MTKFKISSLAIILLTSFFISGCSYRVVDFTMISTKNVDLSRAGTFTRGKTRTEGKDVAHYVYVFPLGGRVSMKEAIDRALEKTPGAVALVDGVVYSKGWGVVLYGQDIIVVEGTPLIDPSLAMNADNIPDYSLVEMDRKGKVKEFKEITEQEYLAIKTNVTKDSQQKQFNNSTELHKH